MSLKPKTVSFDILYVKVEKTVHSILTMIDINKEEWNDRFYDIYSLCIATPEPFDSKLYSSIKELLEGHVRNSCREIQKHQDIDLLINYNKVWMTYAYGIKYMDSLFLYLNTHLVNRNKVKDADMAYGNNEIDFSDKLQMIGELGLEIWRREVIVVLQDRLVNVILSEIKNDRKYRKLESNPTIIKQSINSFVEVRSFLPEGKHKLYEQLFESAYIKETGEFYRSEASDLLKECNVSEYMVKVRSRMNDELMRAERFLPAISSERTQQELIKRMVEDHLPTLHAEVPSMVAQEISQDMINMHFLAKKVLDAITVLVKTFQEHVKKIGLQIVKNLKGDNNAGEYSESLYGVYKKYKKMVEKIFSKDTLFGGALDKAFDDIINYKTSNNKCLSPELLAKYSDQLLKRSNKSMNESDIEEKLDESVVLFKFIHDKDIYHKFYARFLAKRLIHQASQSMELEEVMINRLKTACGYDYTSKLHRMYTDVSLSETLNRELDEYVKTNEINLGINFNIFILQSGCWPIAQTNVSPFSVPQELEQSVQTFETFYCHKFNGRRLTWIHHLCQGELKCSHATKQYIITMSTFQMSMLLMFQNVDSVTYSLLQEHTGLSNEQFLKYLQSLLDHKLLLCSDQKLDQSSIIFLNLKFTNKRTKFKIVVSSAKEAQMEAERTHASVEDDRKMYLQAAVVRIMKMRKIAKHNTLIEEVINQSVSRFSPEISMIKKCIEILIDKAYIERSTENNDEYSYIA